jgi:hypothetical protein
MSKFKIVEVEGWGSPRFSVLMKKNWFTFWKPVRRLADNQVAYWDTRRGAQAYINLQAIGKK